MRPGASGFVGATGCGFGVVAAFFARDVGSEGASIAAAPTAATPTATLPAVDGAAVDVAGAELIDLFNGAAATAGATVWVWP